MYSCKYSGKKVKTFNLVTTLVVFGPSINMSKMFIYISQLSFPHIIIYYISFNRRFLQHSKKSTSHLLFLIDICTFSLLLYYFFLVHHIFHILIISSSIFTYIFLPFKNVFVSTLLRHPNYLVVDFLSFPNI